jgi:hypothetical protein
LIEASKSTVSSEDGALLSSLYNSHFNAQALTPSGSIYDFRPASYMPVSTETLETMLPEGIPDSIIDEFHFTKNQSWMVRDSTRLLCRLLEEKEATLKNVKAPATAHSVPGLHTVVHLPRLTDRSEWESSQLEVTRFGVPVVAPNDQLHASVMPTEGETMFHSKGAQSLVEGIMKNINAQGELPDKILLSGE